METTIVVVKIVLILVGGVFAGVVGVGLAFALPFVLPYALRAPSSTMARNLGLLAVIVVAIDAVFLYDGDILDRGRFVAFSGACLGTAIAYGAGYLARRSAVPVVVSAVLACAILGGSIAFHVIGSTRLYGAPGALFTVIEGVCAGIVVVGIGYAAYALRATPAKVVFAALLFTLPLAGALVVRVAAFPSGAGQACGVGALDENACAEGLICEPLDVDASDLRYPPGRCQLPERRFSE